MTTKICFKCNIEKPLTDYYKHKQMGDGHLNKCKSCTVKDAKATTELKTSTPEGLEKERERHREKYKRLDYKEKQKVWNEKRPHTKNGKYKNLSRKYKVPKGFEIHHWNYEDIYIEDFFVLPIKNHRQAHVFLIKINNIFKGVNGEILDTKEKHFEYLVSKGIVF
jgi:hypothetical protein